MFRKDYQKPNYEIKDVSLEFDLLPHQTRVQNRMTLSRTSRAKSRDILLHGDGLILESLRMNGEALASDRYALVGGDLHIFNAPKRVVLDIVTTLNPSKNTSLMGLYVSRGNFFTQCEAEGFRKITFFYDRPDVMATFTVTLRADKQVCPILLSNGNLIEEGDLPEGRHFAKWVDPFPKPAYLFALVAGQFVCQEETIALQSGRDALLQVWVEEGDLDKTDHAMTALKNSIRWDEQRYGLELDLERFMIVAVSDFNMGAMENKGLNIFNTKFVLANPAIATDVDYANIEAVVGHEYFHNWTGNRVTCRDWFQLSLKEGLTVFRDQEFSADMLGTDSGRAVKRIEDVQRLRQFQFPEDAGPMAHSVRPDSYVEINNFYTVTIYEKGAEVVRMYQTLLGMDGFRKGMDLYFARHDGQAVTCNDFRAAMADANGVSLKQFERWYSQAGTPRVAARSRYNKANKTLTLHLSQTCPATPDQPTKLPFHIPVSVGLLSEDGRDMPLFLDGVAQDGHTVVLPLTRRHQKFVFTNVASQPVVSLLRDFSAPVILDYAYSDAELIHLMACDRDYFNRWEAGQRLMKQRLVMLTEAAMRGESLTLDDMIISAFNTVIRDDALSPAFREVMLALPPESVLAELFEEIDPAAIRKAREYLRETLAKSMKPALFAAYEAHDSQEPFTADAVSAGRRGMKNTALNYLTASSDVAFVALAKKQYATADNMTDRMAAMSALTLAHSPEAKTALEDVLQTFYAQYEDEALAIDKWFTLQATAPNTDVSAILELKRHKAFGLHNPNRARSLILAFCNNNLAQFHASDGSGYTFWADQVLALNAINPQLAARLARSLDHWKKFTPERQKMMKQALERVAQSPDLSEDVAEIVTKSLTQ